MNLYSADIKEQKLDELKNIFPEIFKDGEIDYAALKNILDDVVDEAKSEHYNFTWSGKRECYKTIKEKTNATLKVDEDESLLDGENVFIEGDNLEVLKLLQNAYHKKIKMIYIDPPYNKDKDFVYRDTWGDSIRNYHLQTDQLRDEGYTTTKTNSSGRRHTNWLNMIYPRLWLSRNLLRDDGVIFVSIDDDEVANLRKIMDEIYGEENFVATFIWEKRTNRENRKVVSVRHDYILCYTKIKDSNDKALYQLPMNAKALANYKNLDNDPLGLWKSDPATAQAGHGTKKQFYDLVAPSGKVHKLESGRCWLYTEDVMKDAIKNNKIWFGKDGLGVPRVKTYLDAKERGLTPESILFAEEVATTEIAKNKIKSLFDEKVLFDTPKPVDLLKVLTQLSTKEDDIILDFFAGSGTTAHAVMDLNKEDGGKRKYILVQLPEATDEKSEAYKAGYKKISDITKERIKRVIKKLDYKDGFKSYYLDNSNFQMFKELKKRPNDTLEDIEKMLKMSVFQENILTQGAKEKDLVYEVGLKNGFSLSAVCKEVKSEKYSFLVLSEDQREYYFCFDKEIQNDIIHTLPKEAKLICYEKALGDSVKLNLHANLDLETL
ncbi:Type III restriction-modification system methylation subunit [hydrothermal vent metagenome]|uniref:Type III restriction-modification system methylation subunit n=1 Tax=hydrothermal vent metagenome TaxID=652676 RepID=A0A1W1CS68_9ZZZZ